NRDMTAEDGAVSKQDVIADLTVVSDMRVGHEEAAVADVGDLTMVLGACADRYAFANLAIAANVQARIAAAITRRLRRGAQRRERINHGALADHSNARNVDMGQEPHAGA